MANEKFLKGRFQQKIDIKENWEKAKNFIPLQGEIIVYSDTKQLKIGDGITKINDLPFFLTSLTPSEGGGLNLGDKTSSATGVGAVTMGSGTIASGKGAVAMGEEVVAAGDGSFAQGGKVFRSEAEHVTNAEGKYYAVLDGEYALAHPENCVDVATYPETEPPIVQTSDGMFCYLHDVRYAEAHGYASMVAGQGAVAYSRASKSLGYRTQTGYPPSAEIAALRPETFVKTDENGNPEYPADNVGQDAFAIGADTIAAANQSFAGGWKSKALAHAAFAFGTDNEVRGDSSASFGNGNEVKGASSLAVGANNIIEKNNSIVAGDTNIIRMNNSIVAGSNNTAGGNQSIVVGSNNTTSEKTTQAIFGFGNEADRIGQTVVGIYNVKDTNSLFVVGNGTDTDHKSNGLTVGFSSTDIHNNLKAKKNIIGGEAEIGSSTDHSVVIGGVHPNTEKNTKATTQYNFVFGRGSQATKWGAMALGDNNTSNGFNSLATGADTEALKDNSVTFGKGTKTGRQSQAVVGQWNEVDTGALFVVGNGTSGTNRKNALVVTANGDMEVAGSLTVNGKDVLGMIGDFEAILDSIIKIQNSLIGGEQA